MYCIQCGVQLAASEKKCPLCGTVPYHPDIPREEGIPLYPRNREPSVQVRPKVLPVVVMVLFLLPLLVTVLCDLQISGTVSWSGYVIGPLAVGYVAAGLPTWFRRPNPVIFVPCVFGAVILYLLYIDIATAGGWFLGFAFPAAGSAGLLITAVVTLLRHIRRGRLCILGGAAIAWGGMMLLVEFLLNRTFQCGFVGWSVYPLVVLTALGGLMIFLAINRSARESMERRLFL